MYKFEQEEEKDAKEAEFNFTKTVSEERIRIAHRI